MRRTTPYIWEPGLGATLDEVEIQNQIQCRNHHHEQTEADADCAAAVYGCKVDSEETKGKLHQIEKRNAAGGCDDPQFEVFGGTD